MGKDYVHRCNSGKEVLDKEPVLKTGDWTDYTGNGKVPNPQFQGAGTRASGKALISGENINKLNKWGKIDKLYRTRQHYEYVKIGD